VVPDGSRFSHMRGERGFSEVSFTIRMVCHWSPVFSFKKFFISDTLVYTYTYI